MTPSHKEQISECKDIFLTKGWLIGIMGGAILSLGTIAWSGAQIVTNNDRDHVDLTKRVVELEHASAQIDTVIAILRSRP